MYTNHFYQCLIYSFSLHTTIIYKTEKDKKNTNLLNYIQTP